MTLCEILRAKGTEVFVTLPGVTLRNVTEVLVEHNCGSLVVVEYDGSRKMIGIITERDLMRACAKGLSLDETVVEEVMTRDIITGHGSDSIADTMGLMTENRMRHLPIVENEELVGVISIGDVVKAQHSQLSAENHYLKRYIHS